MTFDRCDIEGLVVITPDVHRDDRGYFFESFKEKEFSENIGSVRFVQDNESFSRKGVVRGLHFQEGDDAQAKLVRCVRGVIFDVAVDLRPGSHTFGKYFKVLLSDKNKKQFFIPRGFAHGFSVLSDTAIFQYKCDNFYCPKSEGGYHPLSKSLSIDWGIPEDEMVLSEKDKNRAEFILLRKNQPV